MSVLVSVATTADGFLDDCTPTRLMISSPEDWAEVHRLRANCDAILVGAETLRRDNPSLVIREQRLLDLRLSQGLTPEPAKITVTRTGALTPEMRFFSTGSGVKIVFSRVDLPQLDGRAIVIRTELLSAAFIVTELEKRGITQLFVEGGAQILRMFFAAGLVDTLRLSVNPHLTVDDPTAPKFDLDTTYLQAPHTTQHLGDCCVNTYTLHPETYAQDRKYLRMAIDLSRRCTPSASSYCVGAVIITACGELFTGYTHETSATHHAEQEAIIKALSAGADLRQATIYTSLEPCSQRRSEPTSCSELILHYGFRCMVFALYEPDCFVACSGALNLRQQGVEVRFVDSLGEEVRAVNAHLFK